MHAECEQFLAGPVVSSVPWRDARVIEIGAQDVNGATRYLVPSGWASWSGVDLVDGPGVDYVGDAQTVLEALVSDGELFDVAICTEVLEHTSTWPWIVKGMLDILRPDGALVITCAAPGRPEHGASGGPLVKGEWYDNVGLDRLEPVVRTFGGVIIYSFQRDEWPQDTYLTAIKR